MSVVVLVVRDLITGNMLIVVRGMMFGTMMGVVVLGVRDLIAGHMLAVMRGMMFGTVMRIVMCNVVAGDVMWRVRDDMQWIVRRVSVSATRARCVGAGHSNRADSIGIVRHQSRCATVRSGATIDTGCAGQSVGAIASEHGIECRRGIHAATGRQSKRDVRRE
jgi:hypothetical protein